MKNIPTNTSRENKSLVDCVCLTVETAAKSQRSYFHLSICPEKQTLTPAPSTQSMTTVVISYTETDSCAPVEYPTIDIEAD
ncbi:Uncharacterized protein FWK35_00014147 [Aphis craccivora]|uniref:Uncharacterized protein n=1 Tax=Aphis craccivora TaxID=307492 RepID=A0A6G0ZNQ4_APHCR|nr:Uncharacterized protein FWK35_00014147 [Aphis craccivora]